MHDKCNLGERAFGACLGATDPDSSSPIQVNTVAADRSFTSRDIESGAMQLNVEVCVIRKLSQRGFYLAFQNSGACVALVSVRVYYKTCPETVRGLAHFQETLAGSEGLTEVPGVCVEEAAEEAGFPPRMHCSADGEWLVPMGRCRCAVGFEEADRSCVGRCAEGQEGAREKMGRWSSGE